MSHPLRTRYAPVTRNGWDKNVNVPPVMCNGWDKNVNVPPVMCNGQDKKRNGWDMVNCKLSN